MKTASVVRKYDTGYKVKQFGAICNECNRKMGHGTVGVVVMHRPHSFIYYYPACFRRRKANQRPGHMV